MANDQDVYVTGLPGNHTGKRPALQAGHPITWGALIAGTVLEGMPYPAPLGPGYGRPQKSVEQGGKARSP